MPGWPVPAKVTAEPPVVDGTSSVTVPSGWVTVRLAAPSGMTSSTGVPGSSASVGVDEPPSSSPLRFARRIGKAI